MIKLTLKSVALDNPVVIEKNRLLDRAKNLPADWQREVANNLNLPLAVIKSAFDVQSDQSGVTITVNDGRLPFFTASNGAIPLVQFDPIADIKGVSVKVKRQRKMVKGAFMKRGRVYRRRDGKVSVAFTTSVTQVAGDVVEKFGSKYFT